MTKRLPVTPAPGPLEEYAKHFDELFTQRSQRHAFRRYLEGLLLPAERNKTLTALANTEPFVGAQHARAQGLQWFLSESTWEPDTINARRLRLLWADPSTTAPDENGALVIDEHGDRKRGKETAHVGRQWLGNLGKVENGVVSVTSLWADERVYYPLEFEPYTPEHHFRKSKADPAFRTKPKIALELVERSIEMGVPFRAVVADPFYGEDEGFKEGLRKLKVGYVLALKPSHWWWHVEGEVGALWQAAREAGWEGENEPGRWVEVVRRFRNGREERWWALEVEAGPYGPEKAHRALVVSTDPARLPDLTTWYLVTNLPAPGSERARREEELAAADPSELVRLYGLRMWVEQSYKQTKHSLGWSQYQVRSDPAIRRHWELVCCAFSFCWWYAQSGRTTTLLEESDAAAAPLAEEEAGGQPAEEGSPTTTAAPTAACCGAAAGREKNKRLRAPAAQPEGVVAYSTASGEGVAGALCNALAILERVDETAPTAPTRRAA